MRIVRFRIGDKTSYGVLVGVHVVEYSGTPFSAFRRGRQRHLARQVVLLPPVKPISALIGPDDPIVHPTQSGRLECEAELAIVMRRRCRNVPRARVREHVLGYTCLNDVTARDLEEKDRMPGRAKAFDTFCPIGPCIVTDIDPNAAAEVMTLLPGDVIGSGTPASVGPLASGDRVEVRIEGIGTLANTVVKV